MKGTIPAAIQSYMGHANIRCEPRKRVKRARRVLRGSRGIFCETHLQSVRAREKYTTRRKAIREDVQASLRV